MSSATLNLDMAASLVWYSPLKMCLATRTSHILTAVWASPVRSRLARALA